MGIWNQIKIESRALGANWDFKYAAVEHKVILYGREDGEHFWCPIPFFCAPPK